MTMVKKILQGFLILFLQHKIKISLLMALLFLQIGYLRMSLYIPTVDKILGIETCTDIGGWWDNSVKKCIKTNK